MADPDDFDNVPLALFGMAVFILAVAWALSFSMTIPIVITTP